MRRNDTRDRPEAAPVTKATPGKRVISDIKYGDAGEFDAEFNDKFNASSDGTEEYSSTISVYESTTRQKLGIRRRFT
jgi:hypothetical protein